MGGQLYWALIWLAVLSALAILAVLLEKKRRRPKPEEGDAVFCFAGIGDADSFLIYQGQHGILIDTGRKEHVKAVRRQLKKAGLKKLELLVLTHPDRDHIGGAAGVLTGIPVERVIQSVCPGGGAERKALDRALAGIRLQPEEPREPVSVSVGELEVTVYPSEKEEYKLNNDYSLITLVRHREVTAFFAGDAQKKRLKEVLRMELEPCTLYKAAHHGKEDAGGAQLIGKLSPQYAVVTAMEADREIEEAFLNCHTKVFYSAKRDVYGISNGCRLKMWQ